MHEHLLLGFSVFLIQVAAPFTTDSGIHVTSSLGGLVTGPQFLFCLFLSSSPKMPPKPKGNSKRTKGVAATVTSKKQTKKAAKHAQALEQLQKDVDETGEEEAVPTTQEDLLQRLDVKMTMLLDLSRKVQA